MEIGLSLNLLDSQESQDHQNHDQARTTLLLEEEEEDEVIKEDGHDDDHNNRRPHNNYNKYSSELLVKSSSYRGEEYYSSSKSTDHQPRPTAVSPAKFISCTFPDKHQLIIKTKQVLLYIYLFIFLHTIHFTHIASYDFHKCLDTGGSRVKY